MVTTAKPSVWVARKICSGWLAGSTLRTGSRFVSKKIYRLLARADFSRLAVLVL
jgi:hypothetical protein